MIISVPARRSQRHGAGLAGLYRKGPERPLSFKLDIHLLGP